MKKSRNRTVITPKHNVSFGTAPNGKDIRGILYRTIKKDNSVIMLVRTIPSFEEQAFIVEPTEAFNGNTGSSLFHQVFQKFHLIEDRIVVQKDSGWLEMYDFNAVKVLQIDCHDWKCYTSNYSQDIFPLILREKNSEGYSIYNKNGVCISHMLFFYQEKYKDILLNLNAKDILFDKTQDPLDQLAPYPERMKLEEDCLTLFYRDKLLHHTCSKNQLNHLFSIDIPLSYYEKVKQIYLIHSVQTINKQECILHVTDTRTNENFDAILDADKGIVTYNRYSDIQIVGGDFVQQECYDMTLTFKEGHQLVSKHFFRTSPLCGTWDILQTLPTEYDEKIFTKENLICFDSPIQFYPKFNCFGADGLYFIPEEYQVFSHVNLADVSEYDGIQLHDQKALILSNVSEEKIVLLEE